MSASENLEICDLCNGSGIDKLTDIAFPNTCPKCAGLGKVDWVEQIVGSSYQHRFNDIVDATAAALAKQIDEEVMTTIKALAVPREFLGK